jgi:uncharacterized alkaline shock family protein YloU
VPVPFELLWVVVVFGVNFALWGSIGILRFTQSVWQGRGSRGRMDAADVGGEPGIPTVQHRLTVQDVAVLIPAHNEETTLARTIDSVARIVPRSNIHVISDASTDRTVAVASGHGVSVLETEGKAGKAGALEEGIRRFGLVERYEAVLLLDADTLLDPGYFEHALPLFDDAEVVAVAGCAHTEWNPPGVSLVGKILITHRARIYAIMQHLIKFGQTWRYTNALYIIPGFASIYRTRVLPHIDINPPGLVIEDFNMTFELYRRRLGRVGFSLRAQAVTQDPGTFGDYLRQTKRWSLGFWQAVRRYRPRADLFLLMLALFITELVVASVLIVLLPTVILVSLLPSVLPGLLEVPLVEAAHEQINLPLVLVAVLIPDLLLSIAVAVLERRPRYLLFAPAFLVLRMVDAAIGLYALPMAWAERSTGSWVSPQRRRVIMVGNVQVEPAEVLSRSRWYAIDLDADAISVGGTANEEWELTDLLERTYPADAPAAAGTADEGTEPVTVVRATARIPVQRADVDRRGVETYRAVVRLAEVGLLSPAPSVPGVEPQSSGAAPGAVRQRFRGRARVGTAGPGTPRARVSNAVVGRAAVPALNRPRADARGEADVPGITVIMAAAVENVVSVAARHVPGVHYAHADVSRPAAALARGGGHDELAGVLMHPDGHAAEVGIDLGIDYGLAAGAVVQNVRAAVVLALRNLLDVEVASVNVVVRSVGSDHGDSLAAMRRSDAATED